MERNKAETGTCVTDHFAAWLKARGETITQLFPGTTPLWRSSRGTADMLRQAYYGEHPSLL